MNRKAPRTRSAISSVAKPRNSTLPATAVRGGVARQPDALGNEPPIHIYELNDQSSTTAGDSVSQDHKAELDRHMAWLEDKLPDRAAAGVAWLRKPSSRLVRIPVGGLLMVGGVFSFLPVLGVWMLPLGLILIAQDVPVLQAPIAKSLGWVEQKWLARRARSVR